MTQLSLPDEQATQALAKGLAVACLGGDVVGLSGPLGAGKTTLVRYLLRALGVDGRVKSPSFALMELYSLPALNVAHFDFYRLGEPNEWREAGFVDQIAAPAVLSLIEWPEQAQGSGLPLDLLIELQWAMDEPDTNPIQRRMARLQANSDRGQTLLRATLQALQSSI
jgi:tRNA threonylcarbamoyladenosine biosynthesis protein TsaE